MLAAARSCLRDADQAQVPADRYVAAHLAALRTAAAVLAARAQPSTGKRASRPTSAWVLLSALAPELAEWAAFFAAGAAKRQAAEAGAISSVGQREADDLMRDAETFLAVVTSMLADEWRERPQLRAVS
jgi:hypothetical protein